MDLPAARAFEPVARMLEAWLKQAPGDLATLFGDRGQQTLEGIEIARLCRLNRRDSGGHQEAVAVLSGPAAGDLHDRLSQRPDFRRHDWGGTIVLAKDRSFIARRAGDLFVATSELALRHLLGTPPDGQIETGGSMLSISLTGNPLQDALNGGAAFRPADLNHVRAVRFDLAREGSRFTLIMSTPDQSDSERLRAAADRFIEALEKAKSRPSGWDAIEDLTAKSEGNGVIVSGTLKPVALAGLLDGAAGRMARNRDRSNAAVRGY